MTIGEAGVQGIETDATLQEMVAYMKHMGLTGNKTDDELIEFACDMQLIASGDTESTRYFEPPY